MTLDPRWKSPTHYVLEFALESVGVPIAQARAEFQRLECGDCIGGYKRFGSVEWDDHASRRVVIHFAAAPGDLPESAGVVHIGWE